MLFVFSLSLSTSLSYANPLSIYLSIPYFLSLLLTLHTQHLKLFHTQHVLISVLTRTHFRSYTYSFSYLHREYLDPVTGQTLQYCTLTGENPVCILDPYPTSNILQIKRATARKVGSTYAPDFLGLMEVALINAWQVR